MHAYVRSYYFTVLSCFPLLCLGCASVNCCWWCDVYASLSCLLYGHRKESCYYYRILWTNTAVRLRHSASRWSQVWYGKIILCRVGDSAKKRWPKSFKVVATVGGGASTITLGAPAVAKAKGSQVTLCWSKRSTWYQYTLKNRINSCFGGHTLDVKATSYAVEFAVSWNWCYRHVRTGFCPENVRNYCCCSPQNDLDVSRETYLELFPASPG